jgi:ADP-ribose pyrophosphatase YjhB (NUDIX family)
MAHQSTDWLEDHVWKLCQQSVPIACVDALPVQREGGRIVRVGLIFRDTPHQGRRWCVVGGRLRRGESVHAALRRQVRETLGDQARIEAIDPTIHLAEYFPTPVPGEMHDPRQHALTPTFLIDLAGEPCPQGEAADFRWFDPADTPAPMGFDQHLLLARMLKRQ